MEKTFTVEEINLICIFESRCRTKVISDIKEAMKYLDDEELVEFSSRTITMLKEISDEEFGELELIVSDYKMIRA